MRKSDGTELGTMAFTRLMDAGGFVTAGIKISNDGTMVCGGDSNGAWKKSPTDTHWVSLYTSDRLPSAYIGDSAPSSSGYIDNSPTGCYAIAVAPSDSSVIYMSYSGRLFKSSDGGDSFSFIGGPYVMMSNTGPHNGRAQTIAIDPQNPNVMMLGPNEGKIIYTTDGGTTVNVLTVNAGSAVSGAAAVHLVGFNPASSVLGGITQGCAYTVEGEGVYESTSGPAGPYTLVSGTPLNPTSLIYDAIGRMWVTQRGATDNVYRKLSTDTGLSHLTTINNEWTSVAVNPANTNQVCMAHVNGNYTTSINGGASWVGLWDHAQPLPAPTSNASYSDVSWFSAVGHNNTYFPSELKFHPTNGTLHMAHGTGVHRSSPPTTYTKWKWYQETAGIQELECGHVICPPGGKALYAVHDQGIFRIDDEQRNITPHTYLLPNPKGLEHGWFLDYAPEDPRFIVATNSFSDNAHGYSTDGGETWTPFAGGPPDGAIKLGGCIIAASKSVLHWWPSNNARQMLSTDGGATWAYNDIAGIPTAAENGWGYSLWNPQHAFCRDDAGNVYAWNYGAPSNTSLQGIYKATLANPTSFTKVFNGTPTGSTASSATVQLIAVPGQPGHLLFKGGPLTRSTDYGVTWSKSNSGLSASSAVCCGCPAPGNTYPAIYMMGKVGSNPTGLYVSDDATATWRLLVQYPMNEVAQVGFIAASWDVYGKVYIAFAHAGGAVGTMDYELTLAA